MALDFKITDELLTTLRGDVVQRRIGTSVEWFRAHRQEFLSIDPRQKNAAAFIGYLSQWVDMGYGEAAIVGELLRRFPQSTRVMLPLYDYIHLELAEGMVASAEEEIEKAIARFDVVIALGEAIDDKELLSLAFFWKARCKRKQGEYDNALKFAEKGRELASVLKYPRIAAVIQVLVSWLYFQKESLPEAIANLKEAEAVLVETDDSVTLGNIQSCYGRIALREARYEQALDHFERAIELYKERDPRHRNLARSLTNIAYVKRLTATRLTQKVDAEADRRRKGTAGTLAVPPTHALNRQRVTQLHDEVLACLNQAEDIYRSLHHHRGCGTVHLERSLLYLDGGDIDRAATEAACAYRLGNEKNDRILMARSCIVHSMIESAKFDEGLSEDFASHAQRALDFARQAVNHAQHTENRHLLARAYICQGMVFSNDYFSNNEESRDCCDRAAHYLTPGIHDRLREEHQLLRARVLRNGNIDVALRKWSQGETEDYTFQQLQDRFADLIIPKVWERESRKVSRVADKLSISPKKVRRILSRLGLKGG